MMHDTAEKVLSTARNEESQWLANDPNTFEPVPYTVSQQEETKVEVVETADNGGVQITSQAHENTQSAKATDVPAAQTPKAADEGVLNEQRSQGEIIREVNTTTRFEKAQIKAFSGSNKGSARKFNAKDRFEQMNLVRKQPMNSKVRNKSNKRSGRGILGFKKRVNRTHNQRMHSEDVGEMDEDEADQIGHNLNSTEIVPPINDPNAIVFPSPAQNILARSKRVKKKKRRFINSQYNEDSMYSTTGFRSVLPKRGGYYKKGTFSRGHSVTSGRSSRSKKKFRSSSKSSKSSRRSSNSKVARRSNVRMKKRYIRNVLPHVQSSENKKLIVEKFTNPGNL